MKPLFYKIYIAMFFLFFSIFAFMTPFMSNVSGGMAEKRTLSALPSALKDGKINVQFPAEFELYFNDNFAFRPYFVALNSKIYYHAFSQSKNKNVIVGYDGYLFFEETVADFLGRGALSSYDVKRLVKTLELADEYVKSKGKSFVFTVAPNKNTIYPDYMPKRYKKSGESSLELLEKALKSSGVSYLSLKDVLVSESGNSTPMYHKKDSHWNNIGAKIAYTALMETLEIKAVKISKTPKITQNWLGDLENMLFPKFQTMDLQHEFNLKKKYKSKKPIRRFDEIKISTKTAKKNKKVLMFRDSFANALIPFLSNEIERIDYVKSVPYDFSEIDAFDVVVLEIVERNLFEVLNRAPVFEALDKTAETLKFSEFKRSENSADGKVFFEKNEHFTSVFGYIDAYENPARPDLIFIEIGEKTFEAFPIYEEALGERVPKSDEKIGFSLNISGKLPEACTVKMVYTDTSQLLEKKLLLKNFSEKESFDK